MDHKTKCVGCGSVMFLMLCWENKKVEKKQPKKPQSRNWKVIPFELSYWRATHILLCRDVILEKHSFQQTVLAWTICLDMEVGIADKQDLTGLCSLWHPPPVYCMFCITDSSRRQSDDHENKGWGKKSLRPVLNDTPQLTLQRKHVMSLSIGTCMFTQNEDAFKEALPKLLWGQLTTEGFEC